VGRFAATILSIAIDTNVAFAHGGVAFLAGCARVFMETGSEAAGMKAGAVGPPIRANQTCGPMLSANQPIASA